MDNTFDKKVNFSLLVKVTLPTVIMMIFFSLYTVIDGVFISRFVGANALSATNIVYPIIGLLLAVGIMFATGGSAIVAKTMGEGKNEEAREKFSLITISALVFACIIAVICIIFIKNIIVMLGATELTYKYCYQYLMIMLIFTPFIVLKMYFDYFLVTAGAAELGLISAIVGGIINIVLDYIFIVKLNFGVSGAAIATCIGYAVPSLVGIVYFINKKHTLHFVKTKFDFKLLAECCSNGSSEMVTMLANSVTTFIYNIVMIKYFGENGVAAITIILYMQFLLSALYQGFTSGTAPWISYNYGSQDEKQIKRIFKNSYLYVFLLSITSYVMSLVIAENVIAAFAIRGSEVYQITLKGFKIFSIAFVINGFNIFTTGMFTAFSNGKISAMLSLMRTFIFFIVGIIIMPKIMGATGVWVVVPFAEVLTIIVAIICINKYKHEYMYGKK